MGGPRFFSQNLMVARLTLAPLEFNQLNDIYQPFWPTFGFGAGFFVDVVRAFAYLNITTDTQLAPSTLQIVSVNEATSAYGPAMYYNDTLFQAPVSGAITNNYSIQPFIQAPNLAQTQGGNNSPVQAGAGIGLIATAPNMYPVDNNTFLQVWIYYHVFPFINTVEGFDLN